MSAILCWIACICAIGLPNAVRCLAYAIASSSTPARMPVHIAATMIRSLLSVPMTYFQP